MSGELWLNKIIPAVLLPSRGGGVSAHMGAGLSATITNRIAQHLAAHDDKYSLSYVISQGEVRRSILQRGLDPALGFLHASQSGRESLALDILEPLRPEVDLFVLTLLDSFFNLKHFTTNDQDGCLLNKKGRSAFFEAWAKWQEPGGEDKKNIRSMAENFVRDLIAFFPDPDFHQF